MGTADVGTITEDQLKILQNHMEHLAEIDVKRDLAHFSAKGIHLSLQAWIKRALRRTNEKWQEIECELRKRQANGMTYQEAVNSFIAGLKEEQANG